MEGLTGTDATWGWVMQRQTYFSFHPESSTSSYVTPSYVVVAYLAMIHPIHHVSNIGEE